MLSKEKEPNISVTFNKIQIGGSEPNQLGSEGPTGASYKEPTFTRKKNKKDPTANPNRVNNHILPRGASFF